MKSNKAYKIRRIAKTANLFSSSTNKGFALLITLVVISIVLAIGLSLLFVTTKQQLLAITAIESEKAFQSAQMGLECMRYHRAQADTRDSLLSGGGAPDLPCAGVTDPSPESSNGPILSMSDEDDSYWTYSYSYRYDIPASDGTSARCVEPSLYISDFRQYNAGTSSEIILPVAGQGLNEMRCTAGTICTAVFARGYNRPCGQLDSIFTIQREISVEF